MGQRRRPSESESDVTFAFTFAFAWSGLTHRNQYSPSKRRVAFARSALAVKLT